MSKITLFLDSNIFIEFFKENEKVIEIFNFILKESDKVKICINAIVWSEVVYQLCIKRDFPKTDVFEFLNNFTKLSINSDVIKIAEYAIDNGLFTNDSLNYATYYYYNLHYFVSVDNDFEKLEEIKLINNISQLKEIL